MNPFELQKERLLFFCEEPANQLFSVYLLLVGLDNFHVEMGPYPNSLLIRYSLQHYSLEALEKALIREGFRLQSSLLGNIKKQMIYYCEDVQYHNLKTPEPRTKNNSQEIFVKAYELHPHGNHDDTPKELREFK
ncbi:hypothetical protein MIZ01_2394 [Sideroxyarcus emersonii]|uniref:Uncharacterized protein n=1 Tax=Sideroxyarcus emersonii TaxID=2764705 RepID=A0AAN1XCD3_9PROT|nr:hypothetical protein [Sideroxyarcus emersonii]BCK88589.1 hypothetical protein MIZ01_2394 [Sideroxyarcus emersonii]